jgi:hypothetical protein
MHWTGLTAGSASGADHRLSPFTVTVPSSRRADARSTVLSTNFELYAAVRAVSLRGAVGLSATSTIVKMSRKRGLFSVDLIPIRPEGTTSLSFCMLLQMLICRTAANLALCDVDERVMRLVRRAPCLSSTGLPHSGLATGRAS